MPFHDVQLFLEHIGFDISHYDGVMESLSFAASQYGENSGIIAYHKSGLVLYAYSLHDRLSEILLFGEVLIGTRAVSDWDGVRVRDVFAFYIDATNNLAQVLKELVNLPYIPVWTEFHSCLRFTSRFDKVLVAAGFATPESIIETRLNNSDRRMKRIMSPNFTEDAEQKFIVTPDILAYSQLVEQPKQPTSPVQSVPAASKKNRFANIVGKKQ